MVLRSFTQTESKLGYNYGQCFIPFRKKGPLPTIAWRKEKNVEWLTSKSCNVDTSLVKHLLLEKVEEIKDHHDKYVIHVEVFKSNKTVLRLPPYHYKLNAIEMA